MLQAGDQPGGQADAFDGEHPAERGSHDRWRRVPVALLFPAQRFSPNSERAHRIGERFERRLARTGHRRQERPLILVRFHRGRFEEHRRATPPRATL